MITIEYSGDHDAYLLRMTIYATPDPLAVPHQQVVAEYMVPAYMLATGDSAMILSDAVKRLSRLLADEMTKGVDITKLFSSLPPTLQPGQGSISWENTVIAGSSAPLNAKTGTVWMDTTQGTWSSEGSGGKKVILSDLQIGAASVEPKKPKPVPLDEETLTMADKIMDKVLGRDKKPKKQPPVKKRRRSQAASRVQRMVTPDD